MNGTVYEATAERIDATLVILSELAEILGAARERELHAMVIQVLELLGELQDHVSEISVTDD